MKKYVSLFFILFTFVVMAACSGSDKPKTDLPLEMAAQKEIDEAMLLYKKGELKGVAKRVLEIKEKYGQTKAYEKAEAQFLAVGFSGNAATQKISMAAASLVELQNNLLAFRRQTGSWPTPGQIRKPVDPWGNETYWIVGTPASSYDVLMVSPGPDGKQGSGDEPIIVWTEDDIGGYKDKKTGKMVGKRKKSRKPLTGKDIDDGHNSDVMSIDDLIAMDKAAGYRSEEMIDLSSLASFGAASKKAGQPKGGDAMVLSIEELAAGDF